MLPVADQGSEPTGAVLVSAARASRVTSLVHSLKGRASTWVLVLKRLDESAYELKRVLVQAGHDCLLIRADFHDADARMQALAMARDFAGVITLMFDCEAALR